MLPSKTPAPVSITACKEVRIAPCQGQLREDDSTSPCCQVEGVLRPAVTQEESNQHILGARSLLSLPPLAAKQMTGDSQTKLKISDFLELLSLPAFMFFSPSCSSTELEISFAVRNVHKYLGHTKVLNLTAEVALSLLSDGEAQPSWVQISKEKQDLRWKPCSPCGCSIPRKIRTITTYL